MDLNAELHPLAANTIASPPAAKNRYLLGVYFLSAVVLAVYNGLRLAQTRSGWEIGEWMINYSGGFVRRGLIGVPLLSVARWTHLSYVWLTFGLEVAVFLILMVTVYRMVIGIRLNYAVAALVLSPATESTFAAH